MSLEDVVALVPREVARACCERAYTLAVGASVPPAGTRFFDPECGPWCGPDDVVALLVPQFEVELRKALGLEVGGVDLADGYAATEVPA